MLRKSPPRTEALPVAHRVQAALTRPAAADESAASGPPSPAGRGQEFNRENRGETALSLWDSPLRGGRGGTAKRWVRGRVDLQYVTVIAKSST